MSVQYVTDNAGDTTAVIIPIGEWEAILHKSGMRLIFDEVCAGS